MGCAGREERNPDPTVRTKSALRADVGGFMLPKLRYYVWQNTKG